MPWAHAISSHQGAQYNLFRLAVYTAVYACLPATPVLALAKCVHVRTPPQFVCQLVTTQWCYTMQLNCIHCGGTYLVLGMAHKRQHQHRIVCQTCTATWKSTSARKHHHSRPSLLGHSRRVAPPLSCWCMWAAGQVGKHKIPICLAAAVKTCVSDEDTLHFMPAVLLCWATAAKRLNL